MTAYVKVMESELITASELLKLLGRKSRQSLYDLMDRDETFPRPIELGSEFSIAWRYREVRKWLDTRRHAVRNGLTGPERRQRAKQTRAAA